MIVGKKEGIDIKFAIKKKKYRRMAWMTAAM